MSDKDFLCGAVETIIFVSERPISLEKIGKYLGEDVSKEKIEEVVDILTQKYEDNSHGISLVKVAKGVQFRTKERYSQYVKNLYKINSLTLTPASLEVLAFIAYRQPVIRKDIDQLRGVDSSHILRSLMDKRLVRPVGRSEKIGQAVTYGTTAEFLEVFNLEDLSQLPPEYELEAMATDSVGETTDIKTLMERKSELFDTDDLEESDRLRDEIRKIKVDTPFTKELRSDKASAEGKTTFDILKEHTDEKVQEDRDTV